MGINSEAVNPARQSNLTFAGAAATPQRLPKIEATWSRNERLEKSNTIRHLAG
jgi:hypothetical protein